MISGLRRYPPELVGSLLKRNELEPGDMSALLEQLAPHDLAVVWLGHGSVLATFGQTSVMVDPVLSARVGPRILGRTWGPVRRQPSPLKAKRLCGVDVLLITHAHFDHLDRPTLKTLASKKTTVVTPRKCKRLIPAGFKEVIEIDHGQTRKLKGVQIHAIEPEHWGARAWLDRHRSFNAYHVANEDGSMLFTGDTAFTQAFNDITPLDIAVFGIGAYDPWEHMHATPEQVWNMFVASGAKLLLPVHHSTFRLSDEPEDEPMQRLIAAAEDDSDHILHATPGQTLVVETQHETPHVFEAKSQK